MKNCQYYSHIVNLLMLNVGINREKLYRISGITSKRAFLIEIDTLLCARRIATVHERLVYCPRVLVLCEINKEGERLVNTYNLNYLPTYVLETELGYVNGGGEPEDNLGYELEITGHEIGEEHRHIFEKPNNIILNFSQFRYFLWSKYLFVEEGLF